jgi:hypothetical protein
MKIIGFGEIILLGDARTDATVSQKEMRVRMPNGTEHGVVVPEGVVKQLLDLWLTNQRKVPTTRVEQAADGETDLGEIKVSKKPAVPAPEFTTSAPRPTFLEDDEDGKQI